MDKQKFLDHSFGEMKSRAEAMSGTTPLLASPREESAMEKNLIA